MWLYRNSRRLLADRRGAVAIIFGLAVFIFALATGAGLEYAARLKNDSVLRAAADSAALGAVVQVRDELRRQRVDPTDPAQRTARDAIATKASADMEKKFRGAVADDPRISQTSARVLTKDVSFDPAKPLRILASMTYSATSERVLLGWSSSPLNHGGEVKSQLDLPYFQSFYFLLDGSGSMGIGADPLDQQYMTEYTTRLFYDNGENLKLRIADQPNGGTGCIFSCHTSDTAPSSPMAKWIAKKHDNYALKVRFTVLTKALKDMLAFAEANKVLPNQYEFSFYIMKGNSSLPNGLLPVIPLNSSNYTSLNTAIDNMVYDAAGTPWNLTMNNFVPLLPVQGDGLSANSRRAAVAIVTDGVEDRWGLDSRMFLTYPWPGFPATSISRPMNPARCREITNDPNAPAPAVRGKGLDLFVLGVKYVFNDDMWAQGVPASSSDPYTFSIITKPGLDPKSGYGPPYRPGASTNTGWVSWIEDNLFKQAPQADNDGLNVLEYYLRDCTGNGHHDRYFRANLAIEIQNAVSAMFKSMLIEKVSLTQ